MLSIVHLDRIQDCLRAVSEVVDAQQRREIDFPKRVLDWLTRAEELLRDARLASLSQLSGFRSSLLATCHGAKKPAGQSRRATLESAASEALIQGQAALSAAIEPRLQQIAEAELLVSRVIAVGTVKGIFPHLPDHLSHEGKLRQLLEALQKDQDTAAATAHFTGILGPVDALIVLDRTLGNRIDG